MKNLEIKTTPEVEMVFDNYPEKVRKRMNELRALVIETATKLEEITSLEETLKWGEPSYITEHGSTLRMDWKSKKPEQFAMYFKCTSRLIETFRTAFRNKFVFEGNRAIIFHIDEQIPLKELKECIQATLRYHRVKHLPTLGIKNHTHPS